MSAFDSLSHCLNADAEGLRRLAGCHTSSGQCRVLCTASVTYCLVKVTASCYTSREPRAVQKTAHSRVRCLLGAVLCLRRHLTHDLKELPQERFPVRLTHQRWRTVGVRVEAHHTSGCASCTGIRRAFRPMSGSMPKTSLRRAWRPRTSQLRLPCYPPAAPSPSRRIAGFPLLASAPPIGLLPRLHSGPGAGGYGKNAGRLLVFCGD